MSVLPTPGATSRRTRVVPIAQVTAALALCAIVAAEPRREQSAFQLIAPVLMLAVASAIAVGAWRASLRRLAALAAGFAGLLVSLAMTVGAPSGTLAATGAALVFVSALPAHCVSPGSLRGRIIFPLAIGWGAAPLLVFETLWPEASSLSRVAAGCALLLLLVATRLFVSGRHHIASTTFIVLAGAQLVVAVDVLSLRSCMEFHQVTLPGVIYDEPVHVGIGIPCTHPTVELGLVLPLVLSSASATLLAWYRGR